MTQEITIPENDRTIRFVAVADQTDFGFDYPVLDKDDLDVWRLRDDDESLLVYETDYDISGIGNQTGGKIILVAGALADDVITLDGARALERISALRPGPRSYDDINQELNRLILMAQELRRDINRAVRYAPTDSGGAQILPQVDIRPNMFLGFDENGKMVAKVGTGGEKGEKGDPGTNGIGVPLGGDALQLLSKKTGEDGETEWVDRPAAGEGNTSSNAGGGIGLAKAKDGVNLPFKSLVAGAGIDLLALTDTVLIAMAASSIQLAQFVLQSGGDAATTSQSAAPLWTSATLDPEDNVGRIVLAFFGAFDVTYSAGAASDETDGSLKAQIRVRNDSSWGAWQDVTSTTQFYMKRGGSGTWLSHRGSWSAAGEFSIDQDGGDDAYEIRIVGWTSNSDTTLTLRASSGVQASELNQ